MSNGNDAYPLRPSTRHSKGAPRPHLGSLIDEAAYAGRSSPTKPPPLRPGTFRTRRSRTPSTSSWPRQTPPPKGTAQGDSVSAAPSSPSSIIRGIHSFSADDIPRIGLALSAIPGPQTDDGGQGLPPEQLILAARLAMFLLRI